MNQHSKLEEERESLNTLRRLNHNQVIEREIEVNSDGYIKDEPRYPSKECYNKSGEHGHHHGKAGKKNYAVIFYTIFTCLSCFYLYTQHLNPYINSSVSPYLSYLTFFDVIMCLWSYIQTIRIKNTVRKLKLDNRYKIPYLSKYKTYDPNYDLYKKKCLICDYYKFPRVSHCSSCGVCIYKMDHHCIWTQTCIGYCNQRSFILFCLYMSFGVIQFWYSTFIAGKKMFANYESFFGVFEPGMYVLWAITCGSAFFVGVMILTLTFGHAFMIMTNYTTLDSVKTKKCCPIPFCEFRNQQLSMDSINTFDRGEIQNLKSLFGENILTFWMPLAREIYNDIIAEKMNPYPQKLQLMKFTELYNSYKTIQQYLVKCALDAREIYRGKKMVINGNIVTA